jgi:hypothetical protein
LHTAEQQRNQINATNELLDAMVSMAPSCGITIFSLTSISTIFYRERDGRNLQAECWTHTAGKKVGTFKSPFNEMGLRAELRADEVETRVP